MPFKFTGRIDKLTIALDRSKLTPEDDKRLMQAQRNNRVSERSKQVSVHRRSSAITDVKQITPVSSEENLREGRRQPRIVRLSHRAPRRHNREKGEKVLLVIYFVGSSSYVWLRFSLP